MPVDPTIADAERADNINDPQLKRLQNVASILARANTRLASIQAAFNNPPDPDKQSTIDTLNAIKREANSSISVADDLLGRIPQ